MARKPLVKRLRKVGGAYYWNPSATLKARGFKSTPLGSELPQAIEAAEALNKRADDALADDVTRAATGPAPGTLAALIALYESSDDWRDKKPATQRGYRWALAEISQKAGHVRVDQITRQELKKLYRSLLPRGARVAKLILQLYSILLSFAEDEGWISDHPGRKLKMKGSQRRRVRWSVPQINLYCATAFDMGEEYAGVARAGLLAYGLGQRITDAPLLARSQYDPASRLFRFQQSKTADRTGDIQEIEAPEWLAAQIATWPVRGPLLVTQPDGRPYDENRLRKLHQEIRAKAGLPAQLQLRDFKRTALTEAGESGATLIDLQSLSGNRTLSSLQHYIVPTETGAARAQAARRKPKGA